MGDEHDSWVKKAFGLDVKSIVQWITADAPPALNESTSSPQEAKLIADFKAVMAPVNERFSSIKSDAEKPKYEALLAKRTALYGSLQAVRSEIDPGNEAKAKDKAERILVDARALGSEAEKLQQEAERAANAWQSRGAAFDKSRSQLDELDSWGDKSCAELRKASDAVQPAVDDHRFDEACKLFDAHLASMKPVYENYLKQKDAKAIYEPEFKSLDTKLPKASLPPEQMAPHVQQRIADTRTQLEALVADKDYVKALPLLDRLALDVGDPDVLAFEGKVLRANADQLKHVLKEIIDASGIMSGAEFCNRLRNANPVTLLRGSERQGLLPDLLKELDAANKSLDDERESFCKEFETTGNKAAKEILSTSRKTIEEEMKRLGITSESVQVGTGDSQLIFKCENVDQARSARKAASDLLPLAKTLDETGSASADAFSKLTASQQADPFNLMSRPLSADHEAKLNAWKQASDQFESGRRTAVSAYPSIAMFAEEPGIVAKLTGLSTASDDVFANEVGKQARERLDNITEVEGAIGSRFVVWNQPHLTKVTLDEMGASSFQREAVDWKASKVQRDAAAEKLLFAAVAIGLGLLAAIPSGGTSLIAGISIAAGIAGAGLALYQVGVQVNAYTLATAANATEFDKAKAISAEDPQGYELAMSCVLALGDVFAAAAAFKALNGLVKAVKAGDVGAALKLAKTAESVGLQGAAKDKIVGDAVAKLSDEAIVSAAKTIGAGGGTTEPAVQRVISASSKSKFQAELQKSMELIKDIQGRIPDTARRAIAEGKVHPFNAGEMQKVYGLSEGLTKWGKLGRNTGGFYDPAKDIIFLKGGSEEEVLGVLIHEATHRVSAASARDSGFRDEAIAHFAEQDFYKLLYGPNGPLNGRKPTAARIQQMLEWTDEELMANVELNYRVGAGSAGKVFARKGQSADDVLKELFSDIEADYKRSLEASGGT